MMKSRKQRIWEKCENNRRKAVEKMQESEKNVAHNAETISSVDLDKLISIGNRKGEEYMSKREYYTHAESSSYLTEIHEFENNLSSLREDMGIL